jgi:hypothetical protein
LSSRSISSSTQSDVERRSAAAAALSLARRFDGIRSANLLGTHTVNGAAIETCLRRPI